jgi:hypothetical protein
MSLLELERTGPRPLGEICGVDSHVGGGVRPWSLLRCGYDAFEVGCGWERQDRLLGDWREFVCGGTARRLHHRITRIQLDSSFILKVLR